jgi:hypothetical protein
MKLYYIFIINEILNRFLITDIFIFPYSTNKFGFYPTSYPVIVLVFNIN